MRFLVITSNQTRHKFFCQRIFEVAGENLVGIVIQNLLKERASKKELRYKRVLSIFFKSPILFLKKFVNKIIYLKQRGRTRFITNGKEPIFPDVSIFNTEDVNNDNCVEFIKKLNPDVILVFGGKILSNSIIRIPKYILNLHTGICPFYKGTGNSLTAAGRQDFRHMGATIHFIDEGIDTGSIISWVTPEFDLINHPDDILFTVQKAGIEEMVRVVKNIIDGKTLQIFSQLKKYGKTYFSKSLEKNKLDEEGKRNINKNFFQKFIYLNSKSKNTSQKIYNFRKSFVQKINLSNKIENGVYIFLYHNVTADLGKDVAQQGLLGIGRNSVEREKFIKQLYFLKKHLTFISLDEALKILNNHDGKIAHKYGVVTFDDGFKTVRSVADPILDGLRIPYSVFINGNPILKNSGLSRLRLSKILANDADMFLKEFNSYFSLSYNTATELFRNFKDSYCVEFEEFVHKYWEELGNIDFKKNEMDFYLNCEDAKYLDKKGVIIGSHTYSHPVLSKINSDLQKKEILGCHEELENFFGKKLNYFAYPFGGYHHFNYQSELIVTQNPNLRAFSAYGFTNAFLYPTNIQRIGLNNDSESEILSKIGGF